VAAQMQTWPLPNINQNSYCQLSSDRYPAKDLANVNPEITSSTIEMARQIIFAMLGVKRKVRLSHIQATNVHGFYYR
jgi:hypothetical protein